MQASAFFSKGGIQKLSSITLRLGSESFISQQCYVVQVN